jgi:hypothetical protein
MMAITVTNRDTRRLIGRVLADASAWPFRIPRSNHHFYFSHKHTDESVEAWLTRSAAHRRAVPRSHRRWCPQCGGRGWVEADVPRP